MGKIKQDLGIIYTQIIKSRPDFILGVALSHTADSVFEAEAVNRFHKTSKVVRNGKEVLSLYVPNTRNTQFLISKKPSSSFCNYSMYQIEHFLEQNQLNIPFAFTHLRKESIVELPRVINNQ